MRANITAEKNLYLLQLFTYYHGSDKKNDRSYSASSLPGHMALDTCTATKHLKS